MEARIELNFLEDLYEGVRGLMRAADLELPQHVVGAQVLLNAFDAGSRRIFPRPRRVHWSAELHAQALSPEHAAALAKHEERFLAGADLAPFQGKGIARPLFQDELLTHWGIQHLHLELLTGTPTRALRSHVFADRTDDLLFVKVDPNDAYFLTVLPHQGAWTNDALVDILHRSFPAVIADARLDVSGWEVDDSKVVDEKTRLELIEISRKSRINFPLLTRDGAAYLGLGGGISGSGRSIHIARLTRALQRRASALEKLARENADRIAEVLAVDAPNLRLRVSGEPWAPVLSVVEMTTGEPIDFVPVEKDQPNS